MNHYVFILLVMCLGCKESTTQDRLSTGERNAKELNQKTSPTTEEAKQVGDYTSLFNSPDCKVITAEEISTALSINFTDMNTKGLCSFKSEFPGNKTWYISILRNDMSSSDIQREIESFKRDETGQLTFEMSESGDTYLCNQHLQGYLPLYNPNYNGSVLIRYGSVGESREFSKEERLEHRDLAFKLANTLLKKHQK